MTFSEQSIQLFMLKAFIIWSLPFLFFFVQKKWLQDHCQQLTTDHPVWVCFSISCARKKEGNICYFKINRFQRYEQCAHSQCNQILLSTLLSQD